ncbi:MAG: Rieske 2Fe-2S domain-containing protein [Magnetococcales bacterium]|nr:Rieske 2Fe-2S domain-containing protein [Magnetococcales bacterium]
MSTALRYLAAARPEAATHLLGFYKQSVQALDDKTRHLIQIVTKVTVGTERGLRQYAPKALKAGASREEILDAVLMAFPAAGLNKILDAIDILLELDLLPVMPTDASDAKAAATGSLVVLARLDELPQGRMQTVHGPDGDLILFRQGDQVKAYDSRCPHSRANLCRGTDHGDSIECRIHNWKFDLASGRCLDPEGKVGLTEVAIAVDQGHIVLR